MEIKSYARGSYPPHTSAKASKKIPIPVEVHACLLTLVVCLLTPVFSPTAGHKFKIILVAFFFLKKALLGLTVSVVSSVSGLLDKASFLLFDALVINLSSQLPSVALLIDGISNEVCSADTKVTLLLRVEVIL